MAAWANAANAAMLAEAYRIAGQTSLMNTYRDAAIAAYNHASGLADQQLDATQDVGYTTVRGRDLKMTAAAYLFNVTGTTAYEDVVNAESVCRTGLAELENDTRNQTWATAAYLLTPRTVRYPTLQGNMRACVIDEARDKEANLTETRPSRRATDDRPGYFRTSQNVQRTMIAHAVATSPADRDFFRKALQLEADWGLGRNPINTIEMGTATTPLSGKRSIQYMYTSGREDGVAGIHPGHTPYLNLDDWFCGMTMGCPSRLYQNTYPADFKNTWPIAEGYFNSPWVWAHSEFTPQQTMRGKTALYGYLYALGGAATPTFALTVGKAGTGSGTVTSSPAGINCGSDCSESYASGTSVTLTASAAGGSTFAGWSGACSGTGTCSVSMTAARSVTATFNTSGAHARDLRQQRQPVGDRGERHDADPGRELRHRRPGRRLQRHRRREQRRAVPHERGRRRRGHDGHGRRLQRGLDQRGRVDRVHRERRGRGNLQPQAAAWRGSPPAPRR